MVVLDNGVWHAVDGTCEVVLPPGTNSLAFSRKPGWHLEAFEVDAAPGQLAARIIPGNINLKSPGVLEMDMGCSGLSPGEAWVEGRASGLDGVQLFHAPLGKTGAPSMLEFSGRDAAISREGCAVQVNTRNDGDFLGTLSLLDCHRPVYPLALADTRFPNWSLSDWWNQCHRKRGLVIWADEPSRGDPDAHGEALAGVLAGKVDALECLDLDRSRAGGIALWEDLLALGLAPALAGSSGPRSNRTFPGKTRSLVHSIGLHWVKAVAGAHTTATTGPSFVVRLDGLAPGQEIRPGAGQVLLEADWDPPSWPGIPVGLVVGLVGSQGLFWKSGPCSGGTIRAEVPMGASCGPQVSVRLACPDGRILAQTSAFRLPGDRLSPSAPGLAARARLLARLDGTTRRLTDDPRHSGRREQAAANLESARAALQSALS